MVDDSLRDRGNSLEEEFFRRQNAELMERLRSTRAKDDQRSQMAAVAGVQDPLLIDQILDHGVTPATFAAMALAPLVAVAWADHRIEDKEKKAILAEAESAGLKTGSPEYDLLGDWLESEPSGTLMATWSSYARSLGQSLGAEQRDELREAMLRRADAVAAAAGGFAGRGKKSAEEQRVLDAIGAALGE